MLTNWTRIIMQTILRDRRKGLQKETHYFKYEIAKGQREFRIILKSYIQDLILITIGVFSAAFGFKGFLLTNHFIDGGATGISLLISALTKIPLYILIIGINIPFIVLAYSVLGKQFAIKTILAISGLSICLATVNFPNVTNDNLLVAVFGGFFLGVGIGMAVRGGSVIDGTEVLAIFLGRKFGVSIGDVIIVINVVIFSAAAYFLSIEIALYSMITYLSASKTLDFIVDGIEEYIGVTIISCHSDKIREMITNHLGRRVTIYNGKYDIGEKKEDMRAIEIIYTVITRLELNKLNIELEKIDPEAFVVMNNIKDAKGIKIRK